LEGLPWLVFGKNPGDKIQTQDRQGTKGTGMKKRRKKGGKSRRVIKKEGCGKILLDDKKSELS